MSSSTNPALLSVLTSVYFSMRDHQDHYRPSWLSVTHDHLPLASTGSIAETPLTPVSRFGPCTKWRLARQTQTAGTLVPFSFVSIV